MARRRAPLLLLLSLALTSLGADCEPDEPGAGSILFADGGADRTVPLGTLVTLDGLASFGGTDDDPLSYVWDFESVPVGSALDLGAFGAANGTAAAATVAFTPDVVGEYVVSLVVQNSVTASTADFVFVTVTPIVPVDPDAGPDSAMDGGLQPVGDAGGSHLLRVFGALDGASGTITSDVGDIDCALSGSSVGSGACEAILPHGTLVTLSATPGPGNAIDSWTVPGETCAGESCAITLNGDKDVIASFAELPAIESFTATPGAIGTGSSSQLGWVVRGATSCGIEPGGLTASLPSGSESVSPAVTTEYTLTCASGIGALMASTSVTVIPNDPPTSAILEPAASAVTIGAGGTVTFSGSCTDDGAGGDTLNHFWFFGFGASPPSSASPSANVVFYADPGVHEVTYDCVDALGAWNATTSHVTVTVNP